VIDVIGLHAIENFAERLRESGRHLIVWATREQPARLMRRAEYHDQSRWDLFAETGEIAVSGGSIDRERCRRNVFRAG